MDAESYPQEILADDEPKYLKRQKPVEIRRRKAGKKPWKTYLKVLSGITCAGLAATTVYAAERYLRTAPAMALMHSDQITIRGNNQVTRASLMGIFAVDRGRSVLRIPLEARRKQIESIPWVEHVSVRRELPNRLSVDVQERVPIAFLRDDDQTAGTAVELIDVHGVTLPKPQTGDFHFPVVTGIHEGLPADERERRMQMYSGFLMQIDAVRGGASQQVSEVDLSDGRNLVATFSDLPGTVTNSSWDKSDGPLVVSFGDHAFQQRFGTLLDQIGQWRATVGRVGTVDLRFNGQVIVNPGLDEAAAPAKVASPATVPLAEQPGPSAGTSSDTTAAETKPAATKPAPAAKPVKLTSATQKSATKRPAAQRATTRKSATQKNNAQKTAPPLATHQNLVKKKSAKKKSTTTKSKAAQTPANGKKQ
jgi:cell division protein FtsQ